MEDQDFELDEKIEFIVTNSKEAMKIKERQIQENIGKIEIMDDEISEIKYWTLKKFSQFDDKMLNGMFEIPNDFEEKLDKIR